MAEPATKMASFITKMDEDEILERAKQIIASRFRERFRHEPITSVNMATEYLRLLIGAEPNERFVVIFLDTAYRLLEIKTLFKGSVNKCSVYPREVLRECMRLNASAIILAHNHPSGAISPSEADRTITVHLEEVLGLVDIKVIDHIIVAGPEICSFAEQGLL